MCWLSTVVPNFRLYAMAYIRTIKIVKNLQTNYDFKTLTINKMKAK